jgi:hypothetical protein
MKVEVEQRSLYCVLLSKTNVKPTKTKKKTLPLLLFHIFFTQKLSVFYNETYSTIQSTAWRTKEKNTFHVETIRNEDFRWR